MRDLDPKNKIDLRAMNWLRSVAVDQVKAAIVAGAALIPVCSSIDPAAALVRECLSKAVDLDGILYLRVAPGDAIYNP